MDTNNNIKKEYNYLIQLIKTICIIFIIVTHVSWTEQERSFFVFPFFIEMAVPVFLLISAYLRIHKFQTVMLSKKNVVDYFVRSLKTLLIPYIWVAIIELVLALFISLYFHIEMFDFITSFKYFAIWLLTGLMGPGSYYVPIMIQLVFYILFLRLLFRKNNSFGLILCFLINIVYEVACYFLSIPEFCYRLLIFRYTLILGFGIYLAKTNSSKKCNYFAILMFVVGASYIVVNQYLLDIPLFYNWKGTSMFCAPYVYAVMYFLIKYLKNVSGNKILMIGKMTYHIYFVQMVFYLFGGNMAFQSLFGFMPSICWKTIGSLFAIFICVSVGALFYHCDMWLRKKVNNTIINRD